MSDNPLEILNKLRKRIKDASNDEGFVLERLAAVPDDGEPYIELMFSLDADHAPKDDLDEMLKGMEEATLAEEAKRKAEESRQGLESLREELDSKLQRPSDGIL